MTYLKYQHTQHEPLIQSIQHIQDINYIMHISQSRYVDKPRSDTIARDNHMCTKQKFYLDNI